MFAKVHPAEDVQSGNRGSCTDLARYLEKEGGEGQTFFSHTENNVSGEDVIINIDHNKKGLKSDDAKFFMLSLNPSESEQRHIIGRDVSDISELTPEERKAAFEKLEDFTRSAMDDYAANFVRENVRTGADLMYFARIETERTYKKTDEAVRAGTATIGEVKPGLNLHVHIIVARKSLDGKTKLSPGAASTGNTWELNGQTVKRGFSHENWKVQVQDTFNKTFAYQPIKDEVYTPKPTPERKTVLKAVSNADLKALLTDEQFTAANQIVAAMREQGYNHQVRKGVHTFSSGSESIKIAHSDLKVFETVLPDERMKDIAGRFDLAKYENNPHHYNDNGLQVKNISFSTLQPTDEAHPNKKELKDVSYSVIYDEQTKTTVPLSNVKKFAYENQINLIKSDLNKDVILNRVKNSDLKTLLTDEKFTAANQVVAAMREQGYNHQVRKGIHTFSKDVDGQKIKVSVRHSDLKKFEVQPTPEQMNDIIKRFNLYTYDNRRASYRENDLTGKHISFSTYKQDKDGQQTLKDISYFVIRDERTKITVPVSAIRQYAKENGINLMDRYVHSEAITNKDLRECLQNPELQTVRQINREMQSRGYSVVYSIEYKSYTYTKEGECYVISGKNSHKFVGYDKDGEREKNGHRGQNRSASGQATGTIGRKLTNKIKNEILGDSFRTERMLSRNINIAIKVVTNPASLKMMLLKKAISFLNPLKEM